tara:strand:- start:900 stop:1079 length:180 start_codon:yes stop_codon:yes gene_type:complete
MRKVSLTAEVTVKTLVDLDELEQLIEDVIIEALQLDQEVQVKVTAEFSGEHLFHVEQSD